MIPNVFVSSTIADLQHLRETIKEALQELAYRPILSEFGDIGYLPQTSTENACYLTMQDCQIAVLIIGKRYGSISTNGVSVTHNEFLAAKEHSIPVLCLADKEVLSYKKVFDETKKGKTVRFPSMDSPKETFSLLQNIMDARTNNAVLPYGSVAEARELIKKQLAHLFGDLLRSTFDPVKANIKDVLSEVMTLRHELKSKEMDPQPFLRASRFLLEDANSIFREFVEQISGSLELAIPQLLKSKTFEDYLNKTETKLSIVEKLPVTSELVKNKELVKTSLFIIPRHDGGIYSPDDPTQTGYWGVLRGKRALMNTEAKDIFDYIFESLKKVSEHINRL